ncbi:MAG: ubiquitin-like small modifier protein 1 [Acidobacteriota bacterium]
MGIVTVRIPTPLRGLTGGQAEVEVDGATVGDVLKTLGARYEGFGERVLDAGGGVRPFVNVYLGDQNIRQLEGLDTPVQDGQALHIVPAVAGGSQGAASGVDLGVGGR